MSVHFVLNGNVSVFIPFSGDTVQTFEPFNILSSFKVKFEGFMRSGFSINREANFSNLEILESERITLVIPCYGLSINKSNNDVGWDLTLEKVFMTFTEVALWNVESPHFCTEHGVNGRGDFELFFMAT